MNENKAFLKIDDLTVEYVTKAETVHAVNNVSLKLEKGKVLGLVGETGAGKTTIARTILRVLQEPPAVVKNGAVWFDGNDLLKMSEEEMYDPCFVVAIQFTNNEGPNVVDMIMHLLESLKGEFSIDAKRVYTSGQNQGCIHSIALDIAYPGYFAGLLLVSGQSDPEEMRAMEGDNIWIIVSEGDKRGFPGMNASVEAWEQDGVVIAKSTWDAKGPAEDMEEAALAQRAEGTNIKYTTFVKGSTWDGDPDKEDPNEHNSTMHAAYNIEAVRDWLFDQVLGEINP